MRSKRSFDKWASAFSRIPSSRIFRSLSRSSVALFVALIATSSFSEQLTPASTRDRKIVNRWSVAGEPRALAIAPDGTIYVGLAQSQSVIAVDPKTGAIKSRLVLDSAEIASTKDLVTMRVSRDGARLYIANGSDESAIILGIPDLHVIREITIEGETIRDALPDPAGRFLYLLGRHVHVYDAKGEKRIHSLPDADPMAIAATNDNIAVIATEDYGNAKATSVVLYDTTSFKEVARDPLQTTDMIEGAVIANGALIAISREHLLEKALVSRAKTMTAGADGRMRMNADFGDMVNSSRICLPEKSGPQILTLAPNNLLIYAERRCNSSGAFTGAPPRVTPASLYGVNAYAIAYDEKANTLAVTDRAGFLTIYRVPRSATAK
jgi:hypothetical protein